MWEQFFLEFFDRSAESIGVVMNASRCREHWLHGELYLAGWRQGLRVNEYSLGGGKRADLSCLEAPRMVVELKVLGGNYESKMRYSLDADAERMSAILDADLERYMVLVIPNSEGRGVLARHLSGVNYSTRCIEREYPMFRLRMWRLEQAVSASAARDVPIEGLGA